MRTTFLAVGLIAAGLTAVIALTDRGVRLPPVGGLDIALLPPVGEVEQVCVETMARSAPDRSWVTPLRSQKTSGRTVRPATLGELRFHDGGLVRVAGYLHVEFEWVALYPSRRGLEQSHAAPWVSLASLWPDEPYWLTKGPSISGRCVVVEGRYVAGAGGHFGMFNGTIADVLRLDVWSSPHRPVITTPPPEPAPVASKQMADGKRWTTENLGSVTNQSYCYEDAEVNCRRYRRLYTWNAAVEGCRSLGDGWRLPTNEEWRQLAHQYGGLREESADSGRAAYTALMSGGSSGFEALFGGNRAPVNGAYERLEAHGLYWSASETGAASAWLYNFGKGGMSLNRHREGNKQMAVSVRCIKD